MIVLGAIMQAILLLSKSKESLWFCYGDIIYNNIKRNIGDKKSICLKCGKRFEQTHGNQEYCESCGHEYQETGVKTIVCVDCGKEVKVDGKVKNKKRCKNCQEQFDKEKNRERVRQYRLRKKSPKS